MGEFSYFKETETWSQSKILSYCFVFGVSKENYAEGVEDSLV